MFRVECLLKKQYLNDFFKFTMFKKAKVIIWLSAILGALGVFSLILSIIEKESVAYSLELIGFALLMFPLWMLLGKFLFGRLINKSNVQLNNTFTMYNFDDEVVGVMDMENNQIKAQAVLGYNSFTHVVETSKYFYLFLNASSAYLLPKEAFTEGTPDEFISFLNNKGIAKKRQ